MVGTPYSHSNNNMSHFRDELENTIHKINDDRLPFCLLGDFNINLLMNTFDVEHYINTLTSIRV